MSSYFNFKNYTENYVKSNNWVFLSFLCLIYESCYFLFLLKISQGNTMIRTMRTHFIETSSGILKLFSLKCVHSKT